MVSQDICGQPPVVYEIRGDQGKSRQQFFPDYIFFRRTHPIQATAVASSWDEAGIRKSEIPPAHNRDATVIGTNSIEGQCRGRLHRGGSPELSRWAGLPLT